MITGMTKDDQIRIVSAQAGVTAAQARAAIESVVGVVIAGLVRDERVSLHGLGTFEVRRRSPRRVRNPASGVMMEVPAKMVVRFKPSVELRSRVEEAHR